MNFNNFSQMLILSLSLLTLSKLAHSQQAPQPSSEALQREIDILELDTRAISSETEIARRLWREFQQEFFIQVSLTQQQPNATLPQLGVRMIIVAHASGTLWSTRVTLSDVTAQNYSQKIDESVAIMTSEMRRYRESFQQGIRFLQQPPHPAGPLANPLYLPGRVSGAVGITAGGGSVPFASVWVQLPAVAERRLGFMPGQMHWLRTQLQVDTTARNTGGGQNPVVFSRIATDIFEAGTSTANPNIRGITAMLRIGTIRAVVRAEPGLTPANRLEIDLIGAHYGDSIALGQTVAVYWNENLRAGVRILEESRGEFAAVFGQTTRLGLLFGNRVFIDGGVHLEIGSGGYYNILDVLTSVGWRINDNATIRAGFNYGVPAAQLQNHSRDPMSLTPEGPSGLGTVFVRF